MRPVLRGIAVLPVVLSILGASAAGQTTDTLRVQVGSHRLFLLASGMVGGPTVVLEAGDRSTHRAWRPLLPQLEQFARVVAYDRAGLGQSEMGPEPRDARTIAQELRAALQTAGMVPPYILVGHSAGGPLVRVFAGMFPEAVAGLVLLDPAAEDAYPRAEREHAELYRRLNQADSLDHVNGTPGELAEDAQWEVWLAQARASDATLRAPVVLLSSPRQDLGVISEVFREEQRRWTERQPRATFRIVSRTGHAIQRDRPDTVVAVIRSLHGKNP